jgi:hypothetical protein
VQHERRHVRAKLGDDEIDPVRHQPGDEMHVAAQAIQLGHRDRAAEPLGLCERGAKLRALGERVRALARLDLDMLFMALLAVAIVALAGCAASGPLAEPCGGFYMCTNWH